MSETWQTDEIFTYHSPVGHQITRMREIRDAGKDLADLIIENSPDSRERDNAITKIDEAVQQANSGIVRNEVG